MVQTAGLDSATRLGPDVVRIEGLARIDTTVPSAELFAVPIVITPERVIA